MNVKPLTYVRNALRTSQVIDLLSYLVKYFLSYLVTEVITYFVIHPLNYLVSYQLAYLVSCTPIPIPILITIITDTDTCLTPHTRRSRGPVFFIQLLN